MAEYHDRTLYLDPQSWDLRVDDKGNLAVVDGPYAIAQNVANAIRLFLGEAWFNRDKGIAHYDIELGHKPPYELLRTKILTAARGVQGVKDARVTYLTFNDAKVLTGSITLMLLDGGTQDVAF